jgi:sterol 14-demethylase
MLLGAIFAGHHTSSGTSAWVLLELLKQPELLAEVRQEVDELFGPDGEVTFQSLREVPKLENVLKEVLRLHPPLIVLMRQVEQDLQVGQYVIKKGDMVWASPPVTQRIPELFPNPETFDPSRYEEGREEDKNLAAYQPFGGGKHKCSGNAFALFQIKAIFCVLLRRYEFELVDSPDAYVDDYTQMIVQPKAPCRIRYRRRDPATIASTRGHRSHGAADKKRLDSLSTFRIVVDRGLCQNHAVCVGEAPSLFKLDEDGNMMVIDETPEGKYLAEAQNAVKFCPNQALSLEPVE